MMAGNLYQIYCILVQAVSIFLVTAMIRKLMSGLEGAEEKAFGPGPESSLEDINNCG